MTEELVLWTFTGVLGCSLVLGALVTLLIEMPLVALPAWFSSCHLAYKQR
jgi:hypothetical protein